MDYYSDYYEARQHLNLSEFAFEIIENDKYVFLEKASRQRIINMVLQNYMDNADASIDNAISSGVDILAYFKNERSANSR